MSNDTPEEIVEKAKKPGVFSIINVLQERAYPKDSIEVSLDEALAFKASRISEKIEEFNKQINNVDDADEIDSLSDKRDELVAQREEILAEIKTKLYTVNITGIPEGRREEIYTEAIEKFPIEYVEATPSLLGDAKREEAENPERDKFITTMFWAEHIESIVDPDGNVQGKMTPEEARALRENLPISASTKINEAIEKIRIATALFMIGVDEDFLAKS